MIGLSFLKNYNISPASKSRCCNVSCNEVYLTESLLFYGMETKGLYQVFLVVTSWERFQSQCMVLANLGEGSGGLDIPLLRIQRSDC